MKRHRFTPRLLLLFLPLLALFIPPIHVRADEPKFIQIGMVKSIFRDIPAPIVKLRRFCSSRR